MNKASDKVNSVVCSHVPAAEVGITSAVYSERLAPFIPEIEHLSNLPGGLALAFDRIYDLGYISWDGLEDGEVGFKVRVSDKPADELMCDIAKRMRALDESFAPRRKLARLEQEAKELRTYWIHSYFPNSIKLLREYCTSKPSKNT